MNSYLKKRNQHTLVIAAFAAIYLIWGSTYLGILFAIKSIPPLFMASARFTIAGVLLMGWALYKGEQLPHGKSIAMISLSGILMLFFGNGAVTWVEQYLPSGLAAIIVATVPLWFVLLDKRQWKFHFSNKQIIFGLCIGFAGVILLFSGKSAAGIFNDRMKIISLFILLIGTICWTAGSLYAKYRKMEGSTTMKVAIQMIASGICFFILALCLKEQKQMDINAVTWQSVVALLYLILFGSLVGYLAYMWLLSVRPASLVGTYAYVNPVVAVFLGWLFAGETISLQQVTGLGIVILGLVIVNISKEKRQGKLKEINKPVETNSIRLHETSQVRS